MKKANPSNSFPNFHPHKSWKGNNASAPLRIVDRFKNMFVENVFSIDIEPRVILLVVREASTTC